MESFYVPCDEVDTSDLIPSDASSSACGLRTRKGEKYEHKKCGPKDCGPKECKPKVCKPKVCKPKECKPRDPKIIYLRGKTGKTGRRGLFGPKGPVGDIGPDGPIGRPGPLGPPGHLGPCGRQGPRGAAGPMGPRGLVGSHGPCGRRGEAGLPGGPPGPSGKPGPPGKPGPQGIVGVKGSKGKPGVKGIQGRKGPAGPQGRPGNAGARGPQGDDGPSGQQGVPGTKGQKGVINNNFNFYLLKFWTTLSIQPHIDFDPATTPLSDVGNIELSYTSSPGFESLLDTDTGVTLSKGPNPCPTMLFVYLDLDAAVEKFFGLFPGYKIGGLDLETRDVIISSQKPIIENGLFKVTFDFLTTANFNAYINQGVVFSLNIRWQPVATI